MMRHRVVIVGAGFAGLAAATRLSAEFDVTVLSRQPWCEFLPNIHELISGQKQAQNLRLEAARRIESVGHRFVLDEVEEIDVEARRVRGRSSGAHAFDALVVATGGVDATRGVAGVDRWAMPFKSVEDCARIGGHLRDLGAKGRAAEVVLVGGGLEGVEALGEILRAFPRFRVRLIDGAPRLLTSAPESLDRTVRRESRPFDVEFRVETRVREVRADGIVTEAGEHVSGDVVVWTGGPRGPRLLHDAGLAEQQGSWAPVGSTLESSAAEAVFIAGDAAELDRPIAKQAYHAIDMGVCAADNAMRRLRGDRLEPFAPAEKPMLVSFGHLGCFLVLGEWAIFGPAVSLAKEAVFQLVSTQLVPPTDVSTAVSLLRRCAGALPAPGWPDVPALVRTIVSAADVRLLAPRS